MSLKRLITDPLDKARILWGYIKNNGGILGSVKTIFVTDELKSGTLIGEDDFGNKYYENRNNFMGRSRWVKYTDKVYLNYDGSQIPPEWHRWMHYMTDEAPSKKPPLKRKWAMVHSENTSGSPYQYVPYSTTSPKVESWTPGKK